MSKRSRRLKRRERERVEYARAVAAVPGLATGLSKAFYAVVELLPKAFTSFGVLVSDCTHRYEVIVAAGVTPFAQSVATGLQRNDSLPPLVFADWCDENGRGSAGDAARRVAARMLEVQT